MTTQHHHHQTQHVMMVMVQSVVTCDDGYRDCCRQQTVLCTDSPVFGDTAYAQSGQGEECTFIRRSIADIACPQHNTTHNTTQHTTQHNTPLQRHTTHFQSL